MNIPDIIMASAAGVGAVGGVVTWVYRRGKDEQQLRDAIRELTKEIREVKVMMVTEIASIKTDILDLKLWRASQEKK